MIEFNTYYITKSGIMIEFNAVHQLGIMIEFNTVHQSGMRFFLRVVRNQTRGGGIMKARKKQHQHVCQNME